jgi:4-hydroxy 2-oxovalerate aldolase
MNNIIISDPTLRDGNHAVKHQLSKEQIALYCKAADKARIPVIEVGHGNGLGASSIQVGLCKETDQVLLETARQNLATSKLGIHVIPGFATINKNIKMAMDIGVDVFRIACHCTEADVTRNHISYVREKGKEVYGVLMMSHMANVETLIEEAKKMESYGAEAVVIMDSAGAYFPKDVEERIKALCSALKIRVGFHGHNNLGMAVINSIVAAQNGATILDACARGFGAGAGNTQLEVLVPVLEREGFSTGIDLYSALDAADIAEKHLMTEIPTIKSTSIVSGIAGVFSGFATPVNRLAKEYNVDPRDIFFKLGERGVVAGQEDVIVEVAIELAKQNGNMQ